MSLPPIHLRARAPLASGSSARDPLRDAVQDLQSVFLQQMLAAARKTAPQEGAFGGGHGEDIFRSLLDQEYASKMSAQMQGAISDALYQQMTRRS